MQWLKGFIGIGAGFASLWLASRWWLAPVPADSLSAISWPQDNSLMESERWRRLAVRAREKALLYEELIESSHLAAGMVVHRQADGEAAGTCDSLLFSSLRYTALEQLGWHDKAAEAWRGIASAYQSGRWLRHPQCKRKSTSRDMMIGLLTAINQKPPLHVEHLRRVLNIVEQTDGSLDDGPFYVSRLSPSIAELLKLMSLARGWAFKSLPEEVKIGFSTVEFDSWLAAPGYTSHLTGLVLWNELLLLDEQQKVRSLADLIDGLGSPVWPKNFAARRLQWSAQQLAEMDPENLFFVWLAHRVNGTLSKRVQADLLARLLSMPAFPDERLPQNCDRRADYLWQRSSWEYQRPPHAACDEEFHGVDFLWMVALLTHENDGEAAVGANDSRDGEQLSSRAL